MLYGSNGHSLDCQLEARGKGVGSSGVCMCVLTWTYCDDIQLDDCCGRESGLSEKGRTGRTERRRKDVLNRHCQGSGKE